MVPVRLKNDGVRYLQPIKKCSMSDMNCDQPLWGSLASRMSMNQHGTEKTTNQWPLKSVAWVLDELLFVVTISHHGQVMSFSSLATTSIAHCEENILRPAVAYPPCISPNCSGWNSMATIFFGTKLPQRCLWRGGTVLHDVSIVYLICTFFRHVHYLYYFLFLIMFTGLCALMLVLISHHQDRCGCRIRFG